MLLPPFCVFCGPCVDACELPGLCRRCRDEIEPFVAGARCDACGVPTPNRVLRRGRCLACARLRPPWSRLVAAGPYGGKLQEVIGAIKFGDRPELAVALGRLMEESFDAATPSLRTDDVDVVVPIPLSRRRAVERGFNQAEQIARVVARKRTLPLETRALEKRRERGEREPQSRLSAARRRRLDAAAFRAREPLVWGRRILLVDDVVTTGSTLRAASKALLAAGARDVRVAVVARTPLD